MKILEYIKSRKNLFFMAGGLLLVTAILCSFITASIITQNVKAKISNQTYKNKEANIENLLVTETKNGEKIWELFAEEGSYTDVEDIVLLKDIIGNFYENNTVKASFKSDFGTYNNKTKEIILSNEILMVYKDNTSIKADRIKYTGKGEDIIATGHVEIEKPGEGVIIGEKAVLKGNYSDFHIEGRTKTKLYL